MEAVCKYGCQHLLKHDYWVWLCIKILWSIFVPLKCCTSSFAVDMTWVHEAWCTTLNRNGIIETWDSTDVVLCCSNNIISVIIWLIDFWSQSDHIIVATHLITSHHRISGLFRNHHAKHTWKGLSWWYSGNIQPAWHQCYWLVNIWVRPFRQRPKGMQMYWRQILRNGCEIISLYLSTVTHLVSGENEKWIQKQLRKGTTIYPLIKGRGLLG